MTDHEQKAREIAKRYGYSGSSDGVVTDREILEAELIQFARLAYEQGMERARSDLAGHFGSLPADVTGNGVKIAEVIRAYDFSSSFTLPKATTDQIGGE